MPIHSLHSYCSSRASCAVDAWERKSTSARDSVFGWPVNREIPYIFSRYDARRSGFPPFSSAERAEIEDPVKETAKKSLNDRSRI